MESKCGQGRPLPDNDQGRQNITRGQYADRRLLINGEVPFREVENIPFSFSSIWQNFTLGDEDGPYLFYLKEGKHDTDGSSP